jgi:hypothetical protein
MRFSEKGSFALDKAHIRVRVSFSVVVGFMLTAAVMWELCSDITIL